MQSSYRVSADEDLKNLAPFNLMKLAPFYPGADRGTSRLPIVVRSRDTNLISPPHEIGLGTIAGSVSRIKRVRSWLPARLRPSTCLEEVRPGADSEVEGSNTGLVKRQERA